MIGGGGTFAGWLCVSTSDVATNSSAGAAACVVATFDGVTISTLIGCSFVFIAVVDATAGVSTSSVVAKFAVAVAVAAAKADATASVVATNLIVGATAGMNYIINGVTLWTLAGCSSVP